MNYPCKGGIKMKKIMILAMSLNGNIAREESDSSLNWTSDEDTAFFKERTKEAKHVIMGRKTFETINRGLPGRIIYVMTGNPEYLKKDIPGVVFTSLSPERLIEKLESAGERECCIAGGKSIYELFLEKRLVDEVYLTVEPVIFRTGVPFCDKITSDVRMQLIKTERLNPSVILLHYRVLNDPLNQLS